jgi:hypothetical protein
VEYCNTESVDPETHESHEEYLAAFKRTLIEKLRVHIDKGLSHDPDGGKGKRKTVQVSFMLHKNLLLSFYECLARAELGKLTCTELFGVNFLRHF